MVAEAIAKEAEARGYKARTLDEKDSPTNDLAKPWGMLYFAYNVSCCSDPVLKIPAMRMWPQARDFAGSSPTTWWFARACSCMIPGSIWLLQTQLGTSGVLGLGSRISFADGFYGTHPKWLMSILHEWVWNWFQLWCFSYALQRCCGIGVL